MVHDLHWEQTKATVRAVTKAKEVTKGHLYASLVRVPSVVSPEQQIDIALYLMWQANKSTSALLKVIHNKQTGFVSTFYFVENLVLNFMLLEL